MPLPILGVLGKGALKAGAAAWKTLKGWKAPYKAAVGAPVAYEVAPIVTPVLERLFPRVTERVKDVGEFITPKPNEKTKIVKTEAPIPFIPIEETRPGVKMKERVGLQHMKGFDITTVIIVGLGVFILANLKRG